MLVQGFCLLAWESSHVSHANFKSRFRRPVLRAIRRNELANPCSRPATDLEVIVPHRARELEGRSGARYNAEIKVVAWCYGYLGNLILQPLESIHQ